MKKIAVVALLLIAGSIAGHAQESRQDVSLSGSVMIEPYVLSTTDVKVSAKRAIGGLASYRFMLTPRGAIEANYGLAQNNITFRGPQFLNGYKVNVRNQEVSFGYVYNFSYRNFNPFIEGGGGVMMWQKILNLATTNLDFKNQNTIIGMYGGGIAYEISPSFDVRVEMRGLVTKVPNFGNTTVSTNRFYNIYDPVVGVAYHF